MSIEQSVLCKNKAEVIALLYKRIRDLREEKDLTQIEIGRELKLGQRTYSYYENGERMLPPEALCALAEFHHTSVDYLLGRTDEKTPYPKTRL